MRYLWDMHAAYTAAMRWPMRAVFRASAHWLRVWDYASAARVDEFVANSRYISRRIEKVYRRPSTVIHPPIRVRGIAAASGRGEYYLSAGRLVDYKRVDLAVQACREMGRPLKIVGDGPARKQWERLAGPDTEFLGRVSDEELSTLMCGCRALLFPGEEDFGIIPVEVQAHGRPVIAYGAGGALETVRGAGEDLSPDAGATGVLSAQQTVEAMIEAMHRFEALEDRFDPQAIHAHAMQFDEAVFHDRFREFVVAALERFHARDAGSSISAGT
jgi:glycosyltransferase involved in cell wall biosynthesis